MLRSGDTAPAAEECIKVSASGQCAVDLEGHAAGPSGEVV